MFNNILVPTDGSPLSQKAVHQAMLLAKITRAHLFVLHVYPRFAGAPYGTYEPAKDVLAAAHLRHYQVRTTKLFGELRDVARAAGVAVETMLVEGDEVYEQILAVAKRRKCDLICMASHGRRGLAAVVLGSETQKVLTHSKIPVLVMR